MHSFLKAEWKTIVTVTLFCSAIFGWFYYQETLKEEVKDAPYEFTCIFAGNGLFNDKLGMSYDELAPKLSGFSQSEDKAIGTAQFESPDHVIIYHFRQNRLTSIEYYPDMEHLDDNCAADFDQIKKTKSQIAEPISYQNRTNHIYEGIVIVKENIEQTDGSNSDLNDSSNEVKSQDIGWIILPV